MSGKKISGSKAAKSASKPPHRLTLADIEALTSHPQIKVADRRLRRALEAITGWRMLGTGGIPKNKFELAARGEAVAGPVKDTCISAPRDWLLRSQCPLCG